VREKPDETLPTNLKGGEGAKNTKRVLTNKNGGGKKEKRC